MRRRRFLNRVWGVLTGILALELAWVAGSFFRPRRRTATERARLFVAGPADGFSPGSVTAFPDGRFYLARLEDGGFLALDRTCTHLGCTVPWNSESGRFECPCHASGFDIAGDVVSPPAPRPLDTYPVRIENGVVKVDVSQRTRRESFDPSQAAQV
jgi:cytochrome b6-f complex iron-sulfur subunit